MSEEIMTAAEPRISQMVNQLADTLDKSAGKSLVDFVENGMRFVSWTDSHKLLVIAICFASFVIFLAVESSKKELNRRWRIIKRNIALFRLRH